MNDYVPSDLEGQEARHEAQRVERKLSRDTEESDLKWLMARKQGRRIVWRLLVQAGTFAPSFNTNAMLMAHAEGRREFGTRVLAAVQRSCPELYFPMFSENSNDSKHKPGADADQQ